MCWALQTRMMLSLKKETELLSKVKSYIEKNNLMARGDRIVLGVSGGADSVALLLLLTELAPEYDAKITAVHVNHGIRGEEADADMRFTENLCARLSVPLRVFREDVRAYSEVNGISLEDAGRRIRYERFETVAREEKASLIAVAHHMDDNAETVMFRAVRGTGIKGLSGMTPKRQLAPGVSLIRPFLCVRRAEITAWLDEKGMEYCTDSTNLNDEYSRNMIRNQILSELEKINTGAVSNLCMLAEQARLTEEFLSREAGLRYGNCVEFGRVENTLQIRIPAEYEPVLFERIMRNALFKVAAHEKDITANHIKLLLELADKQTGSRLSLPYGVTAEKSYDCILLKREGFNPGNEPKELKTSAVVLESLKSGAVQEISVPGYGVFVFSVEEKNENHVNFSKEDYTKYFDYDKLVENPVLRFPADGDYIAISPEGGTKDLKKLFADCKINREERERIPVIAEGNNILWVPDIRTGENRRTDKNTKTVLKIERRK